jgi:hypothetical protein
LKTGSVADLVATLAEQFETSVVPGEFFESPEHFRIGFCGKTELVRDGLAHSTLPVRRERRKKWVPFYIARNRQPSSIMHCFGKETTTTL